MGYTQKPLRDASCAECGCAFSTRYPHARFCSTAHRVAFENRAKVEGKLIIAYVKAWIAGKGGGRRGSHPVVGKCMSEITFIVRDLLEQDRAANRPSPILYAENLFREGLYMDRKKRAKRGSPPWDRTTLS